MIEKKRPILKIPRSVLEKILQGIALLGTISVITVLATHWSRVPGTIPTHFGADGRVDDWGSKGSLLILPIVIVVMLALITILERFPHVFNYIVDITEEKAAFQYQNARTLLTLIKTEITIVFSYIEWKMIEVSLGRAKGLGIAFLPIFIVVVFGTLGIYIYRMLKSADKADKTD